MRGIVAAMALVVSFAFGLVLFAELMAQNANVTGQSTGIQALFNDLPTLYMLVFIGVMVVAVAGFVAMFTR